MLKRKLLKQGCSVVLTREPGGTPLGNRLRRWIKWDSSINVETELLLILAARSQLTGEVIRPALAKDFFVICDRYTYSTLAYQGYGRGMNMSLLQTFNNLVTGCLLPDLVVLLDLGPEEGLKRKNGNEDRFEREELSFHKRVREGYREMAEADPTRWLVVDASLPRGTILEQIWQRLTQMMD
jgi:dTMP kinase